MPTDSGDQHFNGTDFNDMDIDDWAAAESWHVAGDKESTPATRRPEPDQGWQPL